MSWTVSSSTFRPRSTCHIHRQETVQDIRSELASRFCAKKEHLKRVSRLSTGSQGQNLVLTVLCVPSSLKVFPLRAEVACTLCADVLHDLLVHVPAKVHLMSLIFFITVKPRVD